MSRKWTLGVGMILLSAIVIFGTMEPAEADVISINLVTPQDVPSSGGLLSNLPSPYGVVSVNLINPTTAIVSFESSIVGPNIYLFNSVIAVEPNAGQFSVSDVTMTNSGTGFSNVGPIIIFSSLPQPVGNFGSFHVRIDNVLANIGPFGNFAYATDLITFTLHDLSIPWTSASNVLRGNVNNGFGFEAAANISVTPYPANVTNGLSLYGLAASERVLFIPNPSALLLFGSGLVAAVILKRRK